MNYPYPIPLKTVNGNPHYQKMGRPGGGDGQATPFQFLLK